MKNATRKRLPAALTAFTFLSCFYLLIPTRCLSWEQDDRGKLFSSAPGLPVYDVRDYGAKGDGSTDDQPAINLALASICTSTTPAIVYFPAGSYVLSRNGNQAYSIRIPCDNLTLQGVPHKTTLIHQTHMPNAPVTIFLVQGRKNITFRDLIIDGNWHNAVTKVAAASEGEVLSQPNINVVDASFFPEPSQNDPGPFPLTLMARSGPVYISCAGRNTSANQLTGCTGGSGTTLHTDQIIGYVDGFAGINHQTQSTADTSIAASVTLGPPVNISINSALSCGNNAPSPCKRTVIGKTSVGWQRILCTVTNNSTTLSCTGGTGTLATNNEIYIANQTQGRNPGIGIGGSSNVDIVDVTIQRIYGDCIDIGAIADHTWSQDIHIVRTACNIASRDGVAFSSGTRRVTIDTFLAQAIEGQAIDSEPVATPTRDIIIKDSYLDGWWQYEEVDAAPMSVGGATLPSQTISTDARNWRVSNSTMNGTVFISNATDVVFDGNRVIEDAARDMVSPLVISGYTKDVTISNNSIYTRAATGGVEGDSDCCGILVAGYIYARGAVASPTNIHIHHNNIHVRNGRYGIGVAGAGQAIQASTGIATTITSSTLVDNTANWRLNQWIGALVHVGSAQATVASNTACPVSSPGMCTLTLNPIYQPGSSSWMTPIGEYNDTPTAGAYTVTFPTGIIEIDHNTIDAQDDGYGNGRYCLDVAGGRGNQVNTRLRVHHNDVLDCDTYGFLIRFNVVNPSPFKYIELSDNFAHDDQPTPTLTHVIGFINEPKVIKMLLRNNVAGEGVTDAMSGLTMGTWLEDDGIPQQWAGFGSPEGIVAAPVGSQYRRVDGSGVTAEYVKGSGIGKAGWLSGGGGYNAGATTFSVNGTTVSTSTPTVNHGSLNPGSTNYVGSISGIGASSNVTLTLGGSGFSNRSFCLAAPISAGVPNQFIQGTNSASAPVFTCYDTGGAATSCADFTYVCWGQ